MNDRTFPKNPRKRGKSHHHHHHIIYNLASPKRDVWSAVEGILSARRVMRTMKASSTVKLKPIFSPDSAGSTKVKTLMMDIMTTGRIIFSP